MAKKKKKATRKKSSTTRKKKSDHLTTEQIDHFKQILLQKRREIFESVSEIHEETLKRSRGDASGDLSSMPIHMADLETDNYEQEFALGLMDGERKMLRSIDDALIRIDRKTYGICEATQKPIKKARLEAKPWARYCVEYARQLEQGLVKVEEDEEGYKEEE